MPTTQHCDCRLVGPNTTSATRPRAPSSPPCPTASPSTCTTWGILIATVGTPSCLVYRTPLHPNQTRRQSPSRRQPGPYRPQQYHPLLQEPPRPTRRPSLHPAWQYGRWSRPRFWPVTVRPTPSMRRLPLPAPSLRRLAAVGAGACRRPWWPSSCLCPWPSWPSSCVYWASWWPS